MTSSMGLFAFIDFLFFLSKKQFYLVHHLLQRKSLKLFIIWVLASRDMDCDLEMYINPYIDDDDIQCTSDMNHARDNLNSKVVDDGDVQIGNDVGAC